MTMNELFQTNPAQSATTGAKQLPITAELSSHASIIVNTIISKLMDGEVDYTAEIEQSKYEHSALDLLITTAYDFAGADVEYIKVYDSETIDKALKSQQSKRSRIKAIQPLTYDNYLQLMNAAVIEHLIRMAIGKTSKRINTFEIPTDLADNPSDLARRIRNVQSKKSIARGRRDFDETSERWLALLEEEAALKALRPVAAASKSNAVSEAKALLETINDPSSMKASEAKDLLAQIASLLK